MSKKEKNQDGMLEHLASKHADWIRIAKSFTNNTEDAQDLVQEMYIRVYEAGKTKAEISYGDDVNRYFVWTVLFNMHKTDWRHSQSSKTIQTTPIIEEADGVPVTDYTNDQEIAFEVVMEKIMELTKTWNVQDKQLFELYFMRGKTLRGIASGAGIGLNWVHNSIKDIKERLRAELGEDVQDFFNGEFHLIDEAA